MWRRVDAKTRKMVALYAALSFVLVVQLCLLLRNAATYSPTIDEPAHLMSGLRIWQTGCVDSYVVNPPLIRLAAALAIPILQHRVRADSPVSSNWDAFIEGRQFVESGGASAEEIVFLGRCLCIPFCLLGGIACYLWARDLFGAGAGVAACALWSLSPDVLGHGCLVTPDVHAAALLALAGYFYWRWLRISTWQAAAGAGVSLGVACLAKSTLLLCFPLWIGLWLGRTIFLRKARVCGLSALQMLCVFLIAFYLIALGYGFHGIPSYTSQIQFRSSSLMFVFGSSNASVEPSSAQSGFGLVPIPLPCMYLSGIDQQICHFETPVTPSYIRGKFRATGWFYYYAYAVFVKWPSAVLLLLLMSIVLLPLRIATVVESKRYAVVATTDDIISERLFDSFLILFCAIAFLAFVSSQVGMNKHPRYVFPMYPFVFVWVSQLWHTDIRGVAGRTSRLRLWKKAAITASKYVATVLLVSAGIVSLDASPNHLSFFNRIAGGMQAGPRHLIDSAVDWGQDLYRLRKWRSIHSDAPLYVALYCDIDPNKIGIDSFPASRPDSLNPLPDGYYAISVSILQGMPWFASPKPDGTFDTYSLHSFELFRKKKPIAVIGGSILVFEVHSST